MSPVFIDGRELGVAQNGVFNGHNTDLIVGGRLWPEAALTWNLMLLHYVADGGRLEEFVPAGSNSSARSRTAQEHFWYLYTHGGNPAAPLYTSNHGWAIAVDVLTQKAAAWLLIHGESHGWSHDEGARVGEWWHFRYVGAPKRLLRRVHRRGKLAPFTGVERRLIREYDKLKKSGRNPQRLHDLRRVLSLQRKRIWFVSQPKSRGGDGRGWNKSRTKRYNALAARTK